MKLQAEHEAFLKRELGLTLSEIENLPDDEQDKVIDRLFDIEIEEISDGPDNDRCRLASDIVTALTEGE